jgi:hypothetical protein
MTLIEFAKITRNVVSRDGFDGYLPTVVYPERRVLKVLEGAPVGAELESIAVEWASAGANPDEEFLVAFKVDATAFKVVRRASSGWEAQVFAASLDDVQQADEPADPAAEKSE